MSEVNYSKKQINPILEKYGINPSTNMAFQHIITMFPEQTNYQIWAIKAVFDGLLDTQKINEIKVWANENKTEIQNLIKGNIVSYKTKTDFANLFKEMRGLDRLSAVKSTINKFNTAQREMLRAEILEGITDGLKAMSSSNFTQWFEIFKQFESLAKVRKDKVITLASAITNVGELKTHINNALVATYDWDKEDMLSYMYRHAPNCKVVYNKDNIVILQIPDFKSSETMCGKGRTTWCITRANDYFRQYVLDPKDSQGNHIAHQYFYFDFSKKENHELAHIGFTVRDGQGITNAHSTRNSSMTSKIRVDGKDVSVHDVLKMNDIPKNVYIRLKELKNYKWTMESFLEFVSKHPNDFAISVNENGRIILRVMTNDGLNLLLGHTLMDGRNYSVNTNSKVYAMLDFNLDVNEEKSLVLMYYVKDQYKMDSLNTMRDAYNVDIKAENYLSKLGILTTRFLNREKVNPTILLHKFIDEGSEDEAIDLIAKEGDEFDVNYEFNQRTPIFSVIDRKMFKLFQTIVNHKKFNANTCDGFGESLLLSLMYNYKIDGVTSEEEDKSTKKMIDIILNSENFDFNAQNINLDSAINVAVERPVLLWVVEKLLQNPNVRLDIVNDFNCAALGQAIRRGNIEAIKMLAKRKDLVVRPEDLELAQNCGINLSAYVNTTEVNVTTASTSTQDTSDWYSEMFKKAFAKSK